MEPATSWFLVGFINHCATTGTPERSFSTLPSPALPFLICEMGVPHSSWENSHTWPAGHTCVRCSKRTSGGAPAVVQWDWWCLGSKETQVQSPGQHSGLRTQHYCSSDLGLDCGSDLIPSPGASYATGWPKKKKKKKKKKRASGLFSLYPSFHPPRLPHLTSV